MRHPTPPAQVLGPRTYIKRLGQGLTTSHGQALGQEQVSVEAEQAPCFLPVFPSTLLHVPGTTGQQAIHLASFPQSLSLWKLICSGRTLGEMLVVSLADRASDVPPPGHFQAEGETPVAASSHP